MQMQVSKEYRDWLMSLKPGDSVISATSYGDMNAVIVSVTPKALHVRTENGLHEYVCSRLDGTYAQYRLDKDTPEDREKRSSARALDARCDAILRRLGTATEKQIAEIERVLGIDATNKA